MNSREAEKQYNLRKWAQIIKECKSSGEKVMDWIESHNISKDQYYYWQRRLKDAYMDSNLQQSPAFVELTVKITLLLLQLKEHAVMVSTNVPKQKTAARIQVQ